tara:strand:- start:2556 stop:3581 length:1026 start_codon:yes stop_codon:yes gene_type:complete
MKLYANKIAEMVGGLVEGNHLVYINKLSKIENGEHESLSFLGNPKYNQYLYTSKCSIILVEKDIKLDKPVDPTLIRVDDPNESFSILLNYFSSNKTQLIGIDKNSIIEKNVKYAEDLYLGSYSICKIDSKIGNNVKIHSQVFIGENVLIGDNTIIYPGVKIYNNSQVGSNCIIHSGTVIGSDGFGFNLDKNGNQIKVVHNGNVVIEDDVEIGSNCTIDRATLGSTIIKKGVKMDNLIQVAHNVIIGENTVIAALVGIAGSTTIGKNCMLGGQAGVSGHLTIGDRVLIQAQSGVFKNIKSDTSVMGSPAIQLMDYNKSYVHFKNLPSIIKSLEKIFKNNKNV